MANQDALRQLLDHLCFFLFGSQIQNTFVYLLQQDVLSSFLERCPFSIQYICIELYFHSLSSKITSTVIYSQPSMFFHFRFIQPKNLHCWICETTRHQLPRITQAGSVDLSVTEQQCNGTDAWQGIPLKLNLLSKLSLDVFNQVLIQLWHRDLSLNQVKILFFLRCLLKICLAFLDRNCLFPTFSIELFNSAKIQFFFELTQTAVLGVSNQHTGNFIFFEYDILLRTDFKLDVEVHDVKDQVELVEINLVLQKCIGLSWYFNKKLTTQVFGNFRVFKAADVVDGLKQLDVISEFLAELLFVLLEELKCLIFELFLEHHVEKKTHKNREYHSLKLSFYFVKTLVDKFLHESEWLWVILWAVAFIDVVVDCGLCCICACDEIIWLKEGLHWLDGVLKSVSLATRLAEVLSSLALWLLKF